MKTSSLDSVVRRAVSAAQRQAARALRSPSEQLTRLDAMLGKGVGAVKERARLARLCHPK